MADLFQASCKPLFERYRPACWQEVIGQDRALAQLATIRRTGSLSGRAYWISGQSGTGKTTIARLLAHEIADDFMISELDAQEATPSRLKSIEDELQTFGWGDKPGRVVIINEAHGLRNAAIRQLLVTLERIPGHASWIFTTTTDGQESLFEDCQDASPLLSRCIRLDLARRGLAEAFASRCREIAQAEGLDGKPIGDYIRLAKDARNNMRAMLSSIESGYMCG